MTSGAVVLKEYELYTVGELVVLGCFLFISIIGVVLLVFKIPFINKAVMKLPGMN